MQCNFCVWSDGHHVRIPIWEQFHGAGSSIRPHGVVALVSGSGGGSVSAMRSPAKLAIANAVHDIPPALDVLIRERPRLTASLTKLHTFSDITTRLIADSQTDLVTNLKNLEPALRALADIGPKLGPILAFAPVFPLGQSVIDRAVRGDYLNLYAVIDLTIPRLKRTLLRGTRWEDITANLVPAPGEPAYLNYTYDPLHTPINPPPPQQVPAPPTPPDAAPPPGTPLPGGR
jgi:phospholipid/cholesterol/gamma-HCH transport system substrate-binding protein